MVEGDTGQGFAVLAERVDVAVGLRAPVAELDAEFEGGVGLGHHVGFDDPDGVVEHLHLGQGGLADADDPDLVGLDQPYTAYVRLEHADQGGGGHPTGRAAADNDDFERLRHSA